MAFDLLILALILIVGEIYFGHFNNLFPRWRRLRKMTALFVVMGLLSLLVGHWALAFPALMLLGGGIYHWSWCRKYGIGPLTAEPRAKFEALVRQQYHLPQPS